MGFFFKILTYSSTHSKSVEVQKFKLIESGEVQKFNLSDIVEVQNFNLIRKLLNLNLIQRNVLYII
jgi:hypothetical protein